MLFGGRAFSVIFYYCLRLCVFLAILTNEENDKAMHSGVELQSNRAFTVGVDFCDATRLYSLNPAMKSSPFNVIVRLGYCIQSLIKLNYISFLFK